MRASGIVARTLQVGRARTLLKVVLPASLPYVMAGMRTSLALALIALAYVVADTLHAYGFLSVFAAGLGLRQAEVTLTGAHTPSEHLVQPVVGVSGAAGRVAGGGERASGEGLRVAGSRGCRWGSGCSVS